MTSNVGSRDLERRSLGLGAADSSGGAASKEVERTFSPEFRNRLDSVIYFNPLDMKTMEQVVNKQVLELESQLMAKGVDVDVTSEAREWLAKRGYDRLMGARPLNRVMQDQIKKPLAEEILFGKLENGGEVKITIKNDELVFETKSKSGLVGTVSEEHHAER
jgi:ATP-dependent Clp protease ATP-binding subunit ClpA